MKKKNTPQLLHIHISQSSGRVNTLSYFLASLDMFACLIPYMPKYTSSGHSVVREAFWKERKNRKYMNKQSILRVKFNIINTAEVFYWLTYITVESTWKTWQETAQSQSSLDYISSCFTIKPAYYYIYWETSYCICLVHLFLDGLLTSCSDRVSNDTLKNKKCWYMYLYVHTSLWCCFITVFYQKNTNVKRRYFLFLKHSIKETSDKCIYSPAPNDICHMDVGWLNIRMA